jgi:hypothetical protein
VIIEEQKTPTTTDNLLTGYLQMANAVMTLHTRISTAEHYCLELTHEIAWHQDQITALSDRVTLLVAHLERASSGPTEK